MAEYLAPSFLRFALELGAIAGLFVLAAFAIGATS